MILLPCLMRGFDQRFFFQVGNGSRYFQNTIISTGRKPQPVHGVFEQVAARLINAANLLYHPRTHAGIAKNRFTVCKTLVLNETCLLHPFSHRSTVFRITLYTQVVERHRRNFHM